MHAIILAATYERKHGADGREVPLPLLDLHGEPYLTTLVKKLAPLPGLTRVAVVTNEVLRPALEDWAASAPGAVPVEILGDGTRTPEDRLGAVGDLRLGVGAGGADVLVVGGDNWFAYDLQEFLTRARGGRSPAVVLTPLPAGVSPSRYGVAQVDEDGRVTAFVEKPAPGERLPYRASCVYYFAAHDLVWLDRFAAAHPAARSTPGQLIAWLSARTAVYGVPLESTWYDLTGTAPSRLRGPNALEFREELRRLVSPWNQPWERAAAGQLQWVSSHHDLLDVLHDADPNKRIIAARLLGLTGHLLDAAGLEEVRQGLARRKDDQQENHYGMSSSDDDEQQVRVADVVGQALRRLGRAAGET